MASGLPAAVLPPLTGATALRVWQFSPLISAALLTAASAYLAGARRVRWRHPARPWPRRRTASFLAGLAVTGAATQSSLGAYDDLLFSVHMVQHLLLIMVAPPLLVAGRPVTLLLHSAGNPVHTWAKRAVRSRLVAALTWPPGAAAVYCTVAAGTQLAPVMNTILRSGAAHDAEHALYLVAGYLFFLPAVGSEPVRRRVSLAGRFLMLLAVMPAETAIGVVLMLLPREPFAAYARAGRTWGPSLVTDLHQGGTVMWAGSDAVMTVLALAVAVALVRDPRRAGERGGRVEGIRRAVLRQGFARADVAAPPTRAVDDDAHLAAYNAYLSSLGRGP